MNSKKPKVHNYFLGIKMCKVFLIEHANIPTIYFIFLPASDNAQLGAVFLSKAVQFLVWEYDLPHKAIFLRRHAQLILHRE